MDDIIESSSGFHEKAVDSFTSQAFPKKVKFCGISVIAAEKGHTSG
jgi:hypothetical protein